MAEDRLAAAFGALKIERRAEPNANLARADHHVLELSFPDFGIAILPYEDGETTAPAKMKHRSHPPHDPRELALYDADFAVALPLQQVSTQVSKQSEDHMRLFAAVEQLRSGAGISTLGVLRVHQEIWDNRAVRVRLQTQWTDGRPETPPQHFELSDAELEVLFSFESERSWIAVLKDLVTRGSAKAYYHVRQRLLARVGADVADEEERSWPGSWDMKHDKCADELFLARLHALNDNIIAGRMPHFMLECGHAYHLSCDEALKVKHWAIWRLSCEECGMSIMKAEDKEYLDAITQSNHVLKFKRMQLVWANLVQDVHEPNKPRRLHSMSIFRITGAALDSLRSPEWVTSSALCPSSFSETREVLEHLEMVFWTANRYYHKTADELLEELEHKALGVQIDDVPIRDRVNPPGWDDFLTRWLRRTAFFLAYRRCDCGDAGLHGHRTGLWYGPKRWEEEEAAYQQTQEARVFDITDLMRAIDSIPL